MSATQTKIACPATVNATDGTGYASPCTTVGSIPGIKRHLTKTHGMTDKAKRDDLLESFLAAAAHQDAREQEYAEDVPPAMPASVRIDLNEGTYTTQAEDDARAKFDDEFYANAPEGPMAFDEDGEPVHTNAHWTDELEGKELRKAAKRFGIFAKRSDLDEVTRARIVERETARAAKA